MTIDSRPIVLGQLVSLARNTNETERYLSNASFEESSSRIVIRFPSMPEIISLAREAEYNVSSSYVIPDGVHQYKKTRPIEIPFSFSLHSQDPFCSQGSVSLLTMAAKLHALVLPIYSGTRKSFTAKASFAGSGISLRPPDIAGTGKPGSNNPTASRSQTDITPLGTSSSDSPTLSVGSSETLQNTSWPATCILDLISVDNESGSLGIKCVGYIKSVKADLKGPFLNGRPGTGIKGLPMSGDFSFTFVHHPSHTNYLDSLSASQSLLELGAFANDVRTSLFNTRSLSQAAGAAYTGLGDKAPLVNQIGSPLTRVAPPKG